MTEPTIPPTETVNPRIADLIDEYNDIMSSGCDVETPSEYAQREVPKMFEEHQTTPDEKKLFFKAYYGGEMPYGVTTEELYWIMNLCGIQSFTFTLTAPTKTDE